jgi:hypothetical protein
VRRHRELPTLAPPVRPDTPKPDGERIEAMNARPCKELLVKVVNDIGILHKMTTHLADKGIDILAACCWVEDRTGFIRLLTSDQRRAKDVLEKKNFHVEERDAIQAVLAHKVGLLKMMTEFLAREDINVHHLYASARTEDDHCMVVFSCSNNEHAIVALNKAPGAST